MGIFAGLGLLQKNKMQNCFSNSTVAWNEFEIARRESLIKEIPILLLDTWRNMNPTIKIERCETPIITPEKYLQSHIDNNFNLLSASNWPNDARELEHINHKGYLRPETTAGTYAYMDMKFPDKAHLKKYLPYCLWQAGISFRDEKNSETMRASKLRLQQFYQIEFQLFASYGSEAPYLESAIQVLSKNYGGKFVHLSPENWPHYSNRTIDWMIDDLEVAGLSIRNDWPHGMVFEVAIGLDRLVALTTLN
jgi:glycyl-tRNA synthetase